MLEEDKQMSALDSTWQSPEDVLKSEKLDEYIGLFKKLKIQRGIRRWKKGTIEFLNSSKGLAMDGTSKGLIYKPEKPEPLFDFLDQKPLDLERNLKAYRRIDDDWYIVRQDG